MRSLWPRRQHRQLASSLSTVRKQNSSRFGFTPTSYATGLPLALVQLQPAPIRTPRRRRKTMMLQALPSKCRGEARDRPRPSLPARRAMGLGRRAKRNGALAAREPQNGHSSTKHHEHLSSYSCIRFTGRSDAWRDPCDLTARGVRGLHRALRRRAATDCSAALVIIDNRCTNDACNNQPCS